ncbi:hypothetical protein J4458_06900 [Candidatus Woesearchaeota archaeon]|nr:hypothetical protein [Candidatus Woesearchaeota archaeon]
MSKNYSKTTESGNKINTPENIKEDKSFQILKLALDEIKEKYKIAPNEILSLVEEKPVSKEILLPISVFENDKLSALEIICKYLKEELDVGFNKIASLLNRDNRTIWATYNNAIKKKKEKLIVKESKFFIPVSILAERKLSVLGAIVSYLKDNFNLRYSEIAALLNRDERNMWTAYNRAKKK